MRSADSRTGYVMEDVCLQALLMGENMIKSHNVNLGTPHRKNKYNRGRREETDRFIFP